MINVELRYFHFSETQMKTVFTFLSFIIVQKSYWIDVLRWQKSVICTILHWLTWQNSKKTLCNNGVVIIIIKAELLRTSYSVGIDYTSSALSDDLINLQRNDTKAMCNISFHFVRPTKKDFSEVINQKA